MVRGKKPPTTRLAAVWIFAASASPTETSGVTAAANAAANLLELKPPLPPEQRAALHDRVAELLFRAERDQATHRAENARRLLEHDRAAQALGGTHVLKYLECPDTINAAWEYPGFTVVYNGTMVCTMEGGNIVFRGNRAMMRINRDGFAVYPEGIVPGEKTHLPDPVLSMRSQRDGTIDHVRNFLECVRSRNEPNAPVRLCAAAARAAHLGNEAYRTGARVNG